MTQAAPVALTMGEPAGIGAESALMAWTALKETGPAFFLLDDPERLAALAAALGWAVPIRTIADPGEAVSLFRSALPVLPERLEYPPAPGRPDPRNADAVIRSIERAVELVRLGAAGAVATNPIQKSTLYQAGFVHPGHTEFLGALAGPGIRAVMMLACRHLRVVPVTVHVSLREAIATLTTGRIVEDATITARALREDFGIDAPRLAIAGLNPHAGEAGAMGDEEERLIAPAIRQLRDSGIDATGPWSADTLFTTRKRASYDAAICMYHDQALIPVKTLAEDGGVNVTLGLPFVRTSPDHGTALDIAGTGAADPSSLIAAIRMAADMAASRQEKAE